MSFDVRNPRLHSALGREKRVIPNSWLSLSEAIRELGMTPFGIPSFDRSSFGWIHPDIRHSDRCGFAQTDITSERSAIIRDTHHQNIRDRLKRG
jgi:hypothetical protein